MTTDVDISSSPSKEVEPDAQETNETEAICLKTEQCSELMDTVSDTNIALVSADKAIVDEITQFNGESPIMKEMKSPHIMGPDIAKPTEAKSAVVSIKQTSENRPVSNQIINVQASVVSLSSVNECIDRLLTQNFDRVSGPCIITIVKYVLNIVSDPSDPKYRTVSTVNKTFKEKVATASASAELMHSLGFKEVPGSNALCSAATAEDLKATLTLLEGAMDRLQIAPSDRPRPKAIVNTRAQSEVPMPEWDPYQSSIVRTAPQVRVTSRYLIRINTTIVTI
jgi:PUB domain